MGWYLGGNFTQIGDSMRNRIAHIDNAGKVSSWNPNANSFVSSLIFNGIDLYAGGNFTQIGGEFRNRIAKLNNTDGHADHRVLFVNNQRFQS